MEVKGNATKYNNYAEQSRRLTTALRNGFYLEAVFIEYAIIEDRTNSLFDHAHISRYKPKCGGGKPQDIGIDKKIKILQSKAPFTDKYCRDRISYDFLQQTYDWKERRNTLVHQLLDAEITTEDLKSLAEEGKEIVQTFKNKCTSVNRYFDQINGIEN